VVWQWGYTSLYWSVSLFIGPATEAPIRSLAWSVMLILVGSLPEVPYGSPSYRNGSSGTFCPYCMTMHITGLLLAVLVVWRAIKEFQQAIKRYPADGSREGQKCFHNYSKAYYSTYACDGHGFDRSGPVPASW